MPHCWMGGNMVSQRRVILHGASLAFICMVVSSNGWATRVPKLATKELFQKTALVFVGTAKAAPEICKGMDGPCTGVGFTEIEVVAGKLDNRQEISFALPEGALPDGTSLKIAGAPDFIPGVRYLVFIRGGDWQLTPVTNWFHSVFREVRLGARGEAVLFADHQGLAITGLNETGFQLGERIAPPHDLQRSSATGPGGAQSGAAHSRPPKVDNKAKQTLASNAAAAVQLGAPKERLVETIAQLARQYGLNETEPVRFRPGKSSVSGLQRSPEAQPNVGLEKAAPEPAINRKGVLPKARGKDAEPKTTPEKQATVEPSAGKEINPRLGKK